MGNQDGISLKVKTRRTASSPTGSPSTWISAKIERLSRRATSRPTASRSRGSPTFVRISRVMTQSLVTLCPVMSIAATRRPAKGARPAADPPRAPTTRSAVTWAPTGEAGIASRKVAAARTGPVRERRGRVEEKAIDAG